MERIKSDKRSTMDQARISSLCALNFNSEFTNLINLEEAIDIFNLQYKRKVTFA